MSVLLIKWGIHRRRSTRLEYMRCVLQSIWSKGLSSNPSAVSAPDDLCRFFEGIEQRPFLGGAVV